VSSRGAKIEEARIEVETAISRLNRLSASIRQSGVQHRNVKAISFVDKDELGNDLTSHYAAIATLVLDHKFPAADEVIRQRVAKSIAQRRNQFSYRRKHQQKLSRKQEMRTAPIIRTTKQRQCEFSTVPPPTASTSGQPIIQNAILSNTSASAPDPEHLRRRMKTPSSKASTVISATTTQAGALAIPLPPKVDGGDFFECRYCFILCPVKEAHGKYWRLVPIHICVNLTC
jgi:hypothetical protein